MRKVMLQVLVVASILGVSAVSASAIPIDSVSINYERRAATTAPVSSNGGAYPVPNRLSPQPFRPAGRWMD